jgi:hypothetical protein
VSLLDDEGEDTWWQVFFRVSGDQSNFNQSDHADTPQPSRKTVDGWLSSFWKRHFVLTLLPCVGVWLWVALPFPVNDPYKDSPLPDIPSWPRKPKPAPREPPTDGEELPIDVNFYFFLFW